MHRPTCRRHGRRGVGATAQLVGTHAKVLGNLRDVFIRRIRDLAAENPREGGLRHAGATVKLHRGDPVLVEQRSEDCGNVAFLHNAHSASSVRR
ncbi:hypothetical protein D3C71_1953050 [compost metagenome]